MIELQLKPTIYAYDTCRDFAAALHLRAGDIIIINEDIFEPNFKALHLSCYVMFQEKYGSGEPSDEMAEAMYRDMPCEVSRIIGIGGGTVMESLQVVCVETGQPYPRPLRRQDGD